MDIHMPNMDGVEATRAIRKREQEWSRRRTPIIAVTADAMEEDRKIFMEAGIDNYVPKPVRQAELLEALLPLSKATVI
jgi:CheY-like chemotaxis protein